MSAPDRKLFGTDGVRGEAGSFLSAELAASIGRAAASATTAQRPRVLIVRDTRESGPMLAAALASGLAGAGGDVFDAGVLPTPAAAILGRKLGFDLAAVVSASHNPYRDNGIKFFGAGGEKLDDATQAEIERLISDPPEPAAAPGRIEPLRGAEDDYMRALRDAFALDLSGVKVCLDCANGSTHRVAPRIFAELGAEVDAIGDAPDGRNINHESGSTSIGALRRRVLDTGATVGFAFDGDGDRVLAVDGAGEVRDGDELIAIAAMGLRERGSLGGGVAVTVMSNYGFHSAMSDASVEVATTAVGDRFVLEELRRRGWKLGGEQSGHIISMDFAPTGDGIAASLLILDALGGRRLEQVRVMERIPQVLVNVEVEDRDAVVSGGRLAESIAEAERGLAGRGRVLIRPSGTEPLIRVMVEAPTAEEADRVCADLVAAVRAGTG